MEESKDTINEIDDEENEAVDDDDEEVEPDVFQDTERDADEDEDGDDDADAEDDADADADADVDADADDDEDENIKPIGVNMEIMGYDEDDDDYDEDNNPEDEIDYLSKLDDGLKINYVEDYHPEEISINYDEVRSLISVTRDRDGIIVDELHKTLPILTKYEYTRILGVRAKQINEGAVAFVRVDKEVIDGYLIAQIEIKQKKLPFIVKRPIPNGGMEYWKLSDLEILN